jgi:hypothetical protein
MPAQSTETLIDKDRLEKFLKRVPNLSEVMESHSQLVGHFGFFLSEEEGELDITPRKIRACYEAAAVALPRICSHKGRHQAAPGR